MFTSIGGTELLLIFLVILIFFGAEKIPELARGLGKGMNEFKKASENIRNEIEKGQKELEDSYQSPPQKASISNEDKQEVIEEENHNSSNVEVKTENHEHPNKA